jgi:hypothetical protein
MGLLFTYYLGMALPAIAIAAVVGFLSKSWKRFGAVLCAGLALTVLLRSFFPTNGREHGKDIVYTPIATPGSVSSWSDYPTPRHPPR